MPRVMRDQHVELYPRAECRGTISDLGRPSNCIRTWPAGRSTLDLVKNHIRANPTHMVLVVREAKSIYVMSP